MRNKKEMELESLNKGNKKEHNTIKGAITIKKNRVSQMRNKMKRKLTKESKANENGSGSLIRATQSNSTEGQNVVSPTPGRPHGNNKLGTNACGRSASWKVQERLPRMWLLLQYVVCVLCIDFRYSSMPKRHYRGKW